VNLAMNSAQNTFDLADLLAGFATVDASGNVRISGLQIDSRKVVAGDLFIALPGSRQNGNDYIDTAIKQGAAAVIYDAATDFPVAYQPAIPLIKITEISQQTGVIASRFYHEPSKSMRVTGITGTNGKTTCCVLLAQAFQSLGARPGVIGTLGMGLWGGMATATHTTPDAVTLQREMALLRDHGGDELLMEVSSHGLQQGRVSGTEFNIAVLTNLSQDHLDYHGSMQDYAAAKARLFQQHELEFAIINGDDEFGRQLITAGINARRVISYGLVQDDLIAADVHAKHIALHASGLMLQLDSPWGELQIDSKLMGRFNAYNLLACAAVLLATGYKPDEVGRVLSLSESASGRMQRFSSAGATVIVDFAHTPDALQQVLTALREHVSGRRLICVFGCGGDRDKAKRPIMGRIAEQLSDVVIITDDNPRYEEAASIRAEIAAGMQQSAMDIANRKQAIETAWEMAAPDDIILIAGKGHEATQQIGDLKIPCSDIEIVSALLPRPQRGLK
jgi:UDP-N-acetylmuramoyl-L-alanyl-D-glutamate--2,6-diaminopimelate ligase